MSLIRAFFTVSGFTLISRITGFIRDIVMASAVGTGPLADAFIIAFRLPNFFRRLFAEGAFSAAFVPMFTHRLHGEGKEAALTFAEHIYAALLMVLTLFTVFMIATMPWTMYIIAPGFTGDKEHFAMTVLLTRIAFPYLIFISLVTLYAGILNSLGKFAAQAASPIVLNLCLIASLLILAKFTETPAHAMIYGVILAGILQLLWMIHACRKIGIKLRLRKPQLTPDVRAFLRRMGPGLVGTGVVQINLFVDTIIATFIPGALALLYYADRINQLPLALVGTAMGTALLPMLSRQLKAGETAQAMESQNRALELVLFLTIPATAALLIAGHPIILALFERGKFTVADATATAYGLTAYAVGLPAFVIIKILTTTFYADGDTRTPVQIAIKAMIANVVFNGIFIALFIRIGWMLHIGIALATSMACWYNVGLLSRGLRAKARYTPDARLKERVVRIIFSALVMGLLLRGAEWTLDSWLHGSGGEVMRALALCALVGIGAAGYFLTAHFVKAFDMQEIKTFLKRKK